MTTYKYKYINYFLDERMLDNLGDKGWKLVNFVNSSVGSEYNSCSYIFIKEIV